MSGERKLDLDRRTFMGAIAAAGAGAVLAGCAKSYPLMAHESGKAVYDDWTLTSGKAEETIQFSGLDAKAGYALETEFLAYPVKPNISLVFDDFLGHVGGKCTIGRVLAGQEELARDVAVSSTIGNSPMPPAQRWTIPPAAIKDGQVTVRLEKMEISRAKEQAPQKTAGPQPPQNTPVKPEMEFQPPSPFAVHVRILAENSSAKPLTAVLPGKIEIPVVRLSPRPVHLAGVEPLKVDLGGAWQASLKPPAEFWKLTEVSGGNWKQVQVPGELAMQGLEVTDETAAYWREFDCPATWKGQRIKLKCDAIYNDARIWINGVEAGNHVGNFTPFELDITSLVKPGGKNAIAVAVRNDSLADRLSAVSWFVAHYPVGILRKIYLFPATAVNIADVHVLTDFDTEYRNGVLTAKVEIRNESDRSARDLQLRLGLRQRGQGQDAIEPVTVAVPELPAGRSLAHDVRLNVAEPKKWDVEHPNLYDLSVALLRDGKESERISERIGFRKIEVRGSQVFINNRPVRYHGVVWHETDPLRGRSLTGDAWRRDMKLLRGMNCNYIRFQCVGGPPAEELVEACDEVGVCLEEELPYCWNTKGIEALPLTLRSAVEMVMRDRSRASVMQWSLGNELRVDQNLLIAHRLAMLPLDSSRPYLTDGESEEDRESEKAEESWVRGDGNNRMPILNDHYTPPVAVAAWASSPVPVMQGEWGHVMCYNRREIYTDPGVRDNWAWGIADKWEKMVALKSALGGSIWTGVDEYFLMPDQTVLGWGEWGFIDIWRRLKPEYWHFQKIFTPIHIATAALPMPEAGQPIRIPVENRFAFSDLSEIRFDWTLNKQTGRGSASVPPGEKGVVEITLPAGRTAGTLELKAFNYQGLMVDAWRMAVGSVPEKSVPAQPKQNVEWVKGPDHHLIRCGTTAWKIDSRSGMIVSVTRDAKTSPVTGPTLLVLPLSGERFNLLMSGRRPGYAISVDGWTEEWFKSPVPLTAPCTGWKAKSVDARVSGDAVEVVVSGEYTEAAGQFTLRFTPDGELNVLYDFELNQTLMAVKDGWAPPKIVAGRLRPRQMGIVFDLPKECDTLAWRRKTQWTYYPDDHIGRPEGKAKAFPGTPICQGSPFYHTQPTWLWSQDTTPQGSADFRSTKANIYEASLTDAAGSGLRVISDGSQHVRAWADETVNRLLVSDVNCEGCLEYFFQERILPSPEFKPGDRVKGGVRVTLKP